MYKAGQLLILETGEYSDYTFHGPFRVSKDFDMRELSETFKDSQDDPSYCLYGFIGFLSSAGYVEDIECDHIHIGSYGSIEIT